MARSLKHKFGHMNCEACGSLVLVKENDFHTITYSCDECGNAPYAREGQPIRDLWLIADNLIRLARSPALLMVPPAARDIMFDCAELLVELLGRVEKLERKDDGAKPKA